MQLLELNEKITQKSIDEYIEKYEVLKIEDIVWLNELSLFSSNISFYDKLLYLIKQSEEIEYYEGCNKLNKLKNIVQLFFKELKLNTHGNRI